MHAQAAPMSRWLCLTLAALALTLSGCASWFAPPVQKHSGSAVDYLYPNASAAPNLPPGMTTLRPPVRVGVAFAPSMIGGADLSEADKTAALERVKAAFTGPDYIGAIEIIPSTYLRPGGGFTNLEQVARMFNVEVVALVSFDQVQFKDSSSLSLLYWTIVGAYVIHGDRYDVQTMVDAAVFDVASHKLLFRAPGTSQIKGSSSLVRFSEVSRDARKAGYDQAIDAMIPNLQDELTKFRERLKAHQDAGVQVVNKEGYHGGGGAVGLLDLVLLALTAVALRVNMPRRTAAIPSH